jgi:hypothetical protein
MVLEADAFHTADGNVGDAKAQGTSARDLGAVPLNEATAKCGGMGGEKSERRSKSDDAREPTRGTPLSNGRRRSLEPCGGKMAETQAPTPPSRNLHG